MIVTITPNPSLDYTYELPSGEFRLGGVIRPTDTRCDAGGKGVNVARALSLNGIRSRAVLTLGQTEGQHILDLLMLEDLDTRPLLVKGASRVNVTLVDTAGNTTKINSLGSPISPGECRGLIALAVTATDEIDWLVTCGSLPPTVEKNFHAMAVVSGKEINAKTAVDCTGEALILACQAGVDLIKPNVHELSDLVKRPLKVLNDVVAAAKELIALGAGSVIVSMGSQGALYVSSTKTLYATAAKVKPRSTSGAGDSSLAGFLSKIDKGVEEAMLESMAWGAAAVALPGSKMPVESDIASYRGQSKVTDKPDLNLVVTGD
jgi:1-phosphofructokinase family hexose kinase